MAEEKRIPVVERKGLVVHIDGQPGIPVVERKGLVVHIDGQPGPTLNAPILTRPEDWAPAARAILWPELERVRR